MTRVPSLPTASAPPSVPEAPPLPTWSVAPLATVELPRKPLAPVRMSVPARTERLPLPLIAEPIEAVPGRLTESRPALLMAPAPLMEPPVPSCRVSPLAMTVPPECARLLVTMSVPPPWAVKEPAPEVVPAKVEVSPREKTKAAPEAIAVAPGSAPPMPIWTVPAWMAVPPEKVLLPVKVSVPTPDLMSERAPAAPSAKTPAKALAPARFKVSAAAAAPPFWTTGEPTEASVARPTRVAALPFKLSEPVEAGPKVSVLPTSMAPAEPSTMAPSLRICRLPERVLAALRLSVPPLTTRPPVKVLLALKTSAPALRVTIPERLFELLKVAEPGPDFVRLAEPAMP